MEHIDVLIVGAGLSGIGAACHLQDECPERSFAILEARGESGGTWDLFRYPGIRSDSDMFTLGYEFRPWPKAHALADGPSILDYVRATARDRGLDKRIRFNRRVVRAEWSSADARWTVSVERGDDGGAETLTCSFLYANTGYYRYDEGYTPELRGVERFQGTVVHPQHWPEQLDCSGKRVVVIGSGATAVTIVPALAETAQHVTMLQRSPTYVLSIPPEDPLARAARRIAPPHLAYRLIRAKNVALASLLFWICRRAPRFMSRLLRAGVAKRLPEGYDVATHFTPSYRPWDQRLCFVPDGDLFAAIAAGRAEVVTDRIETFTERGLRLASGAELEADVVVTATGLNLLMLGGIELVVDGRSVELSRSVAYKGMMLCGVPNMSFTVGYTNASWTLKADLVARYTCRLLRHMGARGLAAEPRTQLLDLASGYVLRALDQLPKQISRAPWRLYQSYPRDVLLLRRGSVEDEAMEFRRAGATADDAARELLAA
jgi:cation diffusion facilitator CzcD-associated flavoprotein CzcO